MHVQAMRAEMHEVFKQIATGVGMPGTSYLPVVLQESLKYGQIRSMPRHARTALFDQGSKRVTCANDTRTEDLDKTYGWFKSEAPRTEVALRTDGNLQSQIFWLDGVAGTGK